MDEQDVKRGTQLIRDIAAVVTAALVDQHLDHEQARTLGLHAADAVRNTYGGEQLYIPKGLALVISERDREIWRKYDGSNTFALAKEYQLTERQIYSIISRVREEEFLARQGKLFG